MFKRNKNDFKAKLEHKLYLARENPEPIFDISDCGLREVPSGIFSLCRVFLKEILLLDHNKLSCLNNGGSLTDLHNLKVLNLQHNLFTSLPKDIVLLTNLKELYLSNNKIKHLSSNVRSLENLCVLDVSYNALKDLPLEVGNLSKLEYLNVTGNSNLTRLPTTLCCASNLVVLKLDAEKFVYPPVDVLTKGVESIIQYLCEESGFKYAKPEKIQKGSHSNISPVGVNDDASSRLQEQRQKEILKFEKDFEQFHLKELELQAANKVNRQKFLIDMTQQQSKLESELTRIQNMKEQEKYKLVRKLQEEEMKSDLAINQLLNLNKQSLHLCTEQEIEEEHLLILTSHNNEILKRNEIFDAMHALLEKETAKFKLYDQNREETARSILIQEILSNNHLTEVLKIQESQQAELVTKLHKDMELQRFAVGALLENSDARSWTIVQQVLLVETQLAKLTAIEMDRHRLQIGEHLNDLSDKRMCLSILLVDLLAQQEERRSQLVSTLNSMEQIGRTQEDFWLHQYQKLLDRRPEWTSDVQRNIDPEFAHELLLAGVIHFLPFLATWIQTAGYKDELTDEDLTNAGVKNKDDRILIIQAFQQYKKINYMETKKTVEPSAPNPCTSYSEDGAAASAPPESPVSPVISVCATECVVCMDIQCEMIFIPCGHLCCCTNCSSTLQECPLCRGSIDRKIKILLP